MTLVHRALITVLMPVYNGERFLPDAIKSILQQTFRDFEFLIVDDGSIDGSQKIIQKFLRRDRRIFLYKKSHRGIVHALNLGIDLAHGNYIVRMDADDISMPERLNKQYIFMEKHPEIVISGTWAKLIGSKTETTLRPPTSSDEIKCKLLFKRQFVHPTVIMKKSFLVTNNLRYRQAYPYAEDYDLWVQSARLGQLANIGETLLISRQHCRQVSRIHSIRQQASVDKIRKEQLKRLLKLTNKQINDLFGAIFSKPEKSTKYLIDNLFWLSRLKDANYKKRLYPEPEFTHVLSNRLLFICSFASQKLGMESWKIYHISPFAKYNRFNLSSEARFFLSAFRGEITL